MINLLPQSIQSEVRYEYRLRVVALVAYLYSAAVLLGGAMLIPSYVAATMALSDLPQPIAGASGVEDPEAVIARVNHSAELLASFGSAPMPTQTLAAIVNALPGGVSLSLYAFDGTLMGGAISIRGVAQTRNDLAAFDRSMRALPGLVNVQLPISNLAKVEEIPFTLNATIASSTTP